MNLRAPSPPPTDFDVTSLGFYMYKDRDRGLNSYQIEALGVNISDLVQAKATQLRRVVRILDIGCGKGQMLEGLKEQYRDKVQVWGLDLHDYEDRSGIPFVQGSIENGIPEEKFEGKFDLIFSSFAFMYIRNKIQSLLNTAKLLQDQGEAYIHLHSFLISLDEEPKIQKDYNAAAERKRCQKLLRDITGSAQPSGIRYVDTSTSGTTNIFTPSYFILTKEAERCESPHYVKSIQVPWKDRFCYSEYALQSAGSSRIPVVRAGFSLYD